MRSNYKRLGDYIREVNKRNTDLKDVKLLGVSIQKVFIPSIANTIGTNMSTYKLIKKNQFAYGPVTSRNGNKISVALLDNYEEAMISQAYTSFEVIDENELLPEYLMMWFRRSEFDRYARFMSHGSAREIFDWEEMCNTRLPIPIITKQKEIVKEYSVLIDRINSNNRFIQNLEETAQAIYKQWFIDFEFPDKNGKSYKSSGGEMEFNKELDREIPKGWEVMPLSKVASYINRGITPKYVKEGGIIVLNQKCVRDNSIDFSFSKKHDIAAKKIDKNKLLREFDILVNSTGEGTLGRVGLVKEKRLQLTVDSHITIVRSSEEACPLYLWFNISSRTDEIEMMAVGSTGQTELGRTVLGELKILVPHKNVQKAFDEIVSSLVLYLSNIEREFPILDSLKDILLQKMVMFR